MNATEPVKNRFKTLSAALEEIERLEKQVIALNAPVLASKPGAATKAQTPIPATAPAVVYQPQQAATVERPLADLSKRELTEKLDTEHAAGNEPLVAKIWAEYSRRK